MEEVLEFDGDNVLEQMKQDGLKFLNNPNKPKTKLTRKKIYCHRGLYNSSGTNALCWLNSLLVVILHNLPDHMLFAFQNQKNKQMSTLNYSSDEKAFVGYAFDIFRQVIVSNADELEMLNGNAFGYPYAGKLGRIIRKWYNSKQGNDSSSYLYPETHVCLDELVLIYHHKLTG